MVKHLRVHCALLVLAWIGCAREEPPQATPTFTSHPPSTDSTRSIPVTAQAAVEHPERSIWEGVYTDQQRLRGKVIYTSDCVRCHRENLEGNEAIPNLAGEEFLQRWSRKRAGNLFAYMKQEMPPKKKLTPPEYADVLAYILSSNEAPAGESALPSSFAELQAIRMGK